MCPRKATNEAGDDGCSPFVELCGDTAQPGG
jgi:hypothetical protein